MPPRYNNGRYPNDRDNQISSSYPSYPNSMPRAQDPRDNRNNKSPVYRIDQNIPQPINPGIQIDSNPMVQSTYNPNTQLYNVNFKVFYQTIPGESICVLGSIPELGSWKTLKCHMTWTEGHIW